MDYDVRNRSCVKTSPDEMMTEGTVLKARRNMGYRADQDDVNVSVWIGWECAGCWFYMRQVCPGHGAERHSSWIWRYRRVSSTGPLWRRCSWCAEPSPLRVKITRKRGSRGAFSKCEHEHMSCTLSIRKNETHDKAEASLVHLKRSASWVVDEL